MTAGLHPGLWGVLATPFDERRHGRPPVAGTAGPLRACGRLRRARRTRCLRRGCAPVARRAAGGRKHSRQRCRGSTDRPRCLRTRHCRRSRAGGERAGGSQVDAPPAGPSGEGAPDPVRLMVQVNSDKAADVVAAPPRGCTPRPASASCCRTSRPRRACTSAQQRSVEVLRECPFVAAVKAEAPPTPAAIGELTQHTDMPVFGGLGGVGLIDELAMGAAGAMTGFSHPEGLPRRHRRVRHRGLRGRLADVVPVAAAGQLRGSGRDHTCAAQDAVAPSGGAAAPRRPAARAASS